MKISELKIENFKSFKKAEIDFGNITLLTGANSSGKSSLISVLLSIFQTEQFPFYLSPNGNLVNLGNYRNMVYGYEISQNIKIDIKIEHENYDLLNFSTQWENNPVNGLPTLDDSEFISENDNFSIRKNNAKFILNRFSSSHEYNTIDEVITKINEKTFILVIGGAAFIAEIDLIKEFPFNYIHSFRTPPQRNYLQVPKAGKITPTGAGFENQIIEWEEMKSPKLTELISILEKIGLLADIKTNKMGNGMFDILVKTKKNGVSSSLTDVGYGVSKLLPIIVADLQLPDDSLLIISEPEIDLHPSVQANFANYLFEQTKKGKRYIVETHSEYIINRLRLLIAKKELAEEDVKTYYFSNDGRDTTTYPIHFKKEGNIEDAPPEFFNTYEMDVLDIAMQG